MASLLKFGRSIIVADINIISKESVPKDYVIYKAKLSRIKSLQSTKHFSVLGFAWYFTLT